MKPNLPSIAAIATIGFMLLNGCSDQSANSQSGPSGSKSDSTESARNPTALPTGILSASDLSAYARYRLTYKNPDQYSKEPTDTVLDGRKFHIEIRQDKSDPALSFPLSIEYDAKNEVIDYQVYNSSAVSEEENDVVNYIPIYENDTEMPSQTMENAFGVKREITYVKKMIIGIGNVGSKIGIFKPIPHDNGFTYRLSKKLKIDPELARRYDGKYIISFDGNIYSNKKGNTIECYSDKDEPSIDKSHPSDEISCIISAKINSISVLDPAGHMLAHWPSI